MPDGGLAMPESIPQISEDTLQSWRSLTYAQLATEVLSLYISDIPKADLAELCARSYRYDPERAFAHPDIVPIKPIADHLYLLGLSEGPTLAFKDMAMQLLGNLFEYVLAKRGETLNILGATSGDTGSAAEYALRGKRGVNVFMLSPHGRMSAFQKAQMYSLPDANIFNIAVQGVFDECQDIVKALGQDADFKAQYRLGAVNSINFARIAAQIVYYVWAYLRLSDTTGTLSPIDVTVPSGNFGNILSGHMAKCMGVPIRRLVLASNENNVLEAFFRTGIYQPRTPAQTYATSSPSMDISKASNFERFVYHLVGEKGQAVAQLWRELDDKGLIDLSAYLPEIVECWGFVAGCSTHEDRLNTIAQVHSDADYVLDPHTADGVKVAQAYIQAPTPMLVLETALAAKFSDTIVQAIGQTPPVPAHLQTLTDLPQRLQVLPASVEAVRQYIQQHV